MANTAKKSTSTSMSPSFLVRFSECYFFTRRDETGPRGTLYPSAGTHFAYNDADEICRRVRDLGYPDAVVVDRQGVPVTEVSAVEEVSSLVDELWSNEISDHMIMALLRLKEPDEVASQLGMSLSELSTRIAAIGADLETAANDIHGFISGKS